MLKSWVGESGKEVRTVDTMADDFMRLSLNVISAAGIFNHSDPLSYILF